MGDQGVSGSEARAVFRAVLEGRTPIRQLVLATG